jgi:hypothetical protein
MSLWIPRSFTHHSGLFVSRAGCIDDFVVSSIAVTESTGHSGAGSWQWTAIACDERTGNITFYDFKDSNHPSKASASRHHSVCRLRIEGIPRPWSNQRPRSSESVPTTSPKFSRVAAACGWGFAVCDSGVLAVNVRTSDLHGITCTRLKADASSEVTNFKFFNSTTITAWTAIPASQLDHGMLSSFGLDVGPLDGEVASVILFIHAARRLWAVQVTLPHPSSVSASSIDEWNAVCTAVTSVLPVNGVSSLAVDGRSGIVYFIGEDSGSALGQQGTSSRLMCVDLMARGERDGLCEVRLSMLRDEAICVCSM